MNFHDPSRRVLVPVILSVSLETADLIDEMAVEMDISIDEVLSAIAEDSISGLKKPSTFLEDVVIPDRCSTKDLWCLIE